MKHLVYTLLLLPLALSGQSAPNGEALTYFEQLNQLHGSLIERTLDYLRHAVHNNDRRLVAEKRQSLLGQVRQARARLQQVPALAGDPGLHATLLDVLGLYEQLFQLEFDRVEGLKSGSEASYEAMERFINAHSAAEGRLAAAGDRFLQAQYAFARQHNITLLQGPQSSETRQINRLNDYQRGIFLASFRIHRRNAQFLAAMDRQDAAAMTRAQTELVREAEQELGRLRQVPAFNGNTGYRDAVIEQIGFLLQLARQHYPALVKATASPKNILTPTDIEAYNIAVSRLNTDLNARTERVNQSLQTLLRENVPQPAARATKRT